MRDARPRTLRRQLADTRMDATADAEGRRPTSRQICREGKRNAAITPRQSA